MTGATVWLHVYAGTITWSPGFTPTASNAACNADVPLATATTYGVPMYDARSRSSAAIAPDPERPERHARSRRADSTVCRSAPTATSPSGDWASRQGVTAGGPPNSASSFTSESPLLLLDLERCRQRIDAMVQRHDIQIA